MAINVLRSMRVWVGQGQSGYNVILGLAQFNGTDTTGTIECPFPQIMNVLTTNIGGATGENVVCDAAALVGDGMIQRDPNGMLAFKRFAGTTSGLIFSFEIKGY